MECVRLRVKDVDFGQKSVSAGTSGSYGLAAGTTQLEDSSSRVATFLRNQRNFFPFQMLIPNFFSCPERQGPDMLVLIAGSL